MAYNYRLSEEAEADVRDSYLWYEQQKVDLGEEFLMALDAAEKLSFVTQEHPGSVLRKKSEHMSLTASPI